ncbi:hypothetical protein [Hymenobacter lucidus]|uniref:hypothetical protein n=1 Tax=Hymenobacter lucidus TaxID=2880930 RepID=UPI001CF5C1DB|nr:hypothetical protein [Hymenobacter lucidus]
MPTLAQKKGAKHARLSSKPVVNRATPLLPDLRISLAQLQGKWQSVDDKREFWIVKGNSLTMRYATSGTSADDDLLQVQVTDTCAATCATLPAHTVPKGEYLSVVDMRCNEPLCYSVVDVSPTVLTLSYTARGNMLRFRRVKEVAALLPK